MGANKPSRFHGQKPRYKNVERTTLADILPIETNGWENEAANFLADRQLADQKVHHPAGARRDLFKVAPNPELEEAVKRYIADRDTAESPQEKLYNGLKIPIDHQPERVALEAPACALDPKQIAPAAHDILLQMFVEKKIGLGYFHAGRRWQWDREAATLQPSVSIDWSRSSQSPYQDSELTEHQWDAIRRRKRFIAHSGIAIATMLDFFLEPDRGRSELMQLTKMSAVIIECTLEELLEKVCNCFAE